MKQHASLSAASFTARVFGANVTRMDLPAFRASLGLASPSPDLSSALRALWLDARGDWDGAHEAAQADEGGDGDWVHAYLHRKEGDAGNAAYWYRRAGKPVCRTSLDEEWEAIVGALLKASAGRRPSGASLTVGAPPVGRSDRRNRPLCFFASGGKSPSARTHVMIQLTRPAGVNSLPLAMMPLRQRRCPRVTT